MSLEELLRKAAEGGRLKRDEGLALLRSAGLAQLGAAADARCRAIHPRRFRTYNIDRNINYTNVCVAGCDFCAFSRPPGHPEGYVISRDVLFDKIRETVALGGTQILLQGGMHPELPLSWYLDLLRAIVREFPGVNIHGFSPTEVLYFSRLAHLPARDVLFQLREAGLGSLPGGGAEILVDRVRRVVSPKKISAAEWLDFCRTWHSMGGRGSATMMFGHLETLADRIAHLDQIRNLQDETGGFTAFIAWAFQPANTRLSDCCKSSACDYLRTLAVSRLYLDNVANLQASWVTQGMKIGSLSLRFGANDMGSLMIEENVVAAAGTRFASSESELRDAIHDAGYEPRRRNVFYELLDT